MSRIKSTLVAWKATYRLDIPQDAMDAIIALLEEDARKIAEWECRREVRQFAKVMESRLRANDHKPGWKQDIAPALFRRLQEEAAELDGAIDFGTPGEIAKEAADVANFAMMIADVCGGLK
jgi:NTP pyrophosphatase (non-canonical NTP hydrolase)